jgi:surface protein
MTSLFQDSQSLQEVDLSNWNTSNVTNLSNMFSGCWGIEKVNVQNFNVSKVTTIASMFSACYSLGEIDISSWNLALCTNASNVFQNCYSLRKLESCNFSASTTSHASFALNCYTLQKVSLTGIKQTISFSGCLLSAGELNNIYQNLETVGAAGSNIRTITVSSNYGVTGDNPTIAQNKGWAVTG